MSLEGVKALGSKSVTLNVGALVVVLLSFLTIGGVYLHSVQTYERLLGKAEERETRYEKRLEELAAKWEADREKLLELSQQQNKVTERIVYRDREADKKIEEVTENDRSTERIAEDVTAAYGFEPKMVVPDLIGFSPPQVQTFVATKIDRDRLQLNLTDTQQLLHLEQDKTKILTEDLGEAQTQLKDAEGVIEGYKKVAKKSKWKRFWDGTKKVAIFAGGVLIGRSLSR